MIVIRSTAIIVPTGMRIVVLRETGWAGVVNEKSLGAELGRLSGRSEDCFWLGERNDSGKGGLAHFRFL